ncbi:early nodulin-20-like [Phragmites australis]|uniref:early nodulin-20-like n=1 Tax=Phragmites australis TaxID=29695 RepID=UPI002D79D986|nr:early nodulin-20-like [Phragmites australis]
MEALMVISEHRNPHHRHSGGRSKSSGPHFSSPPSSRGFRGMNCRSFHSAACVGLLPSPPSSPTRTYSCPEPKTPKQQLRHGGKRSRPISISPSKSPPSRSELWAGPAFSNSPPPSSLPIPKFSLRQKRSISLELPPVERSDDVEVRQHAKSAPSSPVGGSGYDFFDNNETAIATENLRRILQLDIADH